ncbi:MULTISPECIES: hypothetical protein [Paenibacillus]|uniref:Uncharacterized protein n=1 Tax=Paenibacillus azoreducens TaxID=116718 RepID=A0A919YIG3_9BACL|nr:MULTISPECIES: hypothetical protein [Paenibacillus]MBE9916574.1 hypothetical protein [Paenibacillus donghaensis]GIO51271.1 hypothetical protein J34TS1_60360 [Paenibacillus azoreducens]
MILSERQQEALNKAQKHGGKLIRWNQGGYWTYEEAAAKHSDPSLDASTLEWCCTTNTIFALVRRGFMMMDNWESCSLIHRGIVQEDL